MINRFLSIFSFVLIASCKSSLTKVKTEKPVGSILTLNTRGSLIETNQADSTTGLKLKEFINVKDMIVNDYLTVKLKPIRENFKRINSMTDRTSINKKELWETTEGGKGLFYYNNNTLEKIINRHFGETFQKLTEYYLLDKELSFVLEKSFQCIRPIDCVSTKMNEMVDKEVLDFQKPETLEDRGYFIDGELIHQANNQDCGYPMADDHLAEGQIRIFDSYIYLT